VKGALGRVLSSRRPSPEPKNKFDTVIGTTAYVPFQVA
jgi:hypothetical protein